MPIAPRPDGKAKNIADSIFGRRKRSGRKKKGVVEQNEQALVFQNTIRQR